ncbi:MAG: DUF11 domain-containing protein [Clostridia bacterium]|nr:DUF11 domain-containing protein [Clostridia bacterium]
MAEFSNQATLSYGGVVKSSNVVTGEIVGVLTVTKTAVGTEYTPGGSVTYIVSIVNSGSADASGITVTDDLGAYGGTPEKAAYVPLSYVDGTVKLFVGGVPGTAPSVTSGASLVFGGITVPAGGNVMLVYETEVTAEADGTAGAEIVNTVTAEGTGFDPVTASAAVPVAEGPVLALTKALTPQTVSENGTLTYTFTLTNTGNAEADAATGVVLADTFDPVLTGVTVTLGGAVWPDTNYVYDPVTGSFTTNSGAITVPAATFARAPDGTMTSDPGVTVITVTGTV